MYIEKDRNKFVVRELRGDKRVSLKRTPDIEEARDYIDNINLERYGEQMYWPIRMGHKIKHPLYATWEKMLCRCNNKNYDKYRYYGGKGISVCDRWSKSFYAFIFDMKDKPSNKHTLDRIDSEKGYYPENCRWANKTTQGLNKGTKKKVNRCIEKKGNHLCVRISSFKNRVYFGRIHNIEDAIKIRDEQLKILLDSSLEK